MTPLTKKQKDLLKKHSVHHSKKHLDFMKRLMRGGTSFNVAHKRAQAKVGK
tara:strand:+ start:429 stop:581 length:153 start_codon:yes stop_codon:yes gene_type:complete